ncbi:MAG: small conductance mechanosensitive channel [Oceanicoccus sp.]|jgi:small conductance mechanosensitive channel
MDLELEQELRQAAEIYNLVVEFFVAYSFQILGALIIFLIGLFVANKVSKLVFSLCQKRELDITLSRFVASFSKIVIVVMVAIIALGKLGISVTPFLAIVGALSLGVGLAVQGLLSNYSAGLTIVLTRPFVVGDTISVQGVTGIVKEVHLALTMLTNEDGVEISIPNKHIIGEIIHNSHANILVEVSIGVAYDSDLKLTIAAISAVLNSFDEVCKDHPAQVGVDEFGDSSINMGIRFWTPTENYYAVRYRVNLAIFNALQEHNITIPFPQREVRIQNENAAA